jgi:hypothetical protein
VRSPGNERGAHGRIGPSFALKPPGSMAWEDAVAAYRADFGASDMQSKARPKLVETGIELTGSEAEQTGIMHDGSRQNPDELDPPQILLVQSSVVADQHDPVPAHLSVDVVGGRGEGEGGEGQQGSATPKVSRSAEAHAVPASAEDSLARAGSQAERTGRDPQTAPLTADEFWGPAKTPGGTNE